MKTPPALSALINARAVLADADAALTTARLRSWRAMGGDARADAEAATLAAAAAATLAAAEAASAEASATFRHEIAQPGDGSQIEQALKAYRATWSKIEEARRAATLATASAASLS